MDKSFAAEINDRYARIFEEREHGDRCWTCSAESACRFMLTDTRWECTDCFVKRHYRWWTCAIDIDPVLPDLCLTLKLGPITVVTYRWSDGRRRVSWTWLCGDEHIVIGGPLA